jgi:hypothetical protein
MKYLRYYSEFYDTTQVLWRVEILQEAAAAFTPEEITLQGESPLVIDWHSIEKTDTAMGSAATLVLNSDRDRQFIDMYQIEVGAVRLDVYRNGALYWSGTLDTELYEEPYSYEKNYDVELTFSDFAVLERKDCSLAGFMTIRQVLDACLEATGIQYGELVQHISTSRTGVIPENLLANEKIICDNFYDEDGEPLSLMEVLEGVLKPYDLHIRQKAGKIYLWDWNALCDVASEEVVWDSDDATLGVDSVYNKIKINFSPYQVTDLIASKIKEKSYVPSSPDFHVNYDYDGSDSLPGFDINFGSVATGLELKNSNAKFYHVIPKASGDESYGIAWTIDIGHMGSSYHNGSWLDGYERKLNAPTANISAGALFACPEKPWITYRGGALTKNKLKLTVDLLFDPRYNPFEQASEFNEEKKMDSQILRANFAYIPIKLTLRDAEGNALYHYYNKGIKDSSSRSDNGTWVAGEANWGDAWLCWYDEQDRKKQTGLNGYSTNKRCIGVTTRELPKSFTHNNEGQRIDFPQADGWLELVFGTGVVIYDNNREVKSVNYDNCHWVLYKDPKIELIDQYGESIDKEDIEIKAWLNRSAKEELSIDTIIGTTKKNITMAKGFIMDNTSGAIMEEYTRNNHSGTLEQLLIGTMYSHYASRHTKLSGTVLATTGFNTYTDRATLDLFALMAERQDVMQGCSEIELCQISKDVYDAIEYDDEED